MSTYAQVEATIKAIGVVDVPDLARAVSCNRPDRDSLGAKWLRSVRDNAVDAAEQALSLGALARDTRDYLHEVAAESVPHGKDEMWAVFVDVQAYRQDVSGLVEESTDMEGRARAALYAIAQALMDDLLKTFQETMDDLEDEDEEDA